jgi:hypothetical protein
MQRSPIAAEERLRVECLSMTDQSEPRSAIARVGTRFTATDLVTSGRCLSAAVSRSVLWAAGLLVFVSCNLGTLRPTDKLKESVQEMNEAARWGRIDIAAQYVGPTYRQRFFASHASWGRRIQIGELEVVRLDLNPNRRAATVLVAISWYGLNQMSLRQSLVRQRWNLFEGQFVLDDEEVLEGEPSLFAAPSKSIR